MASLRRAPPDFLGRFTGYYARDDGSVVFCQEAHRHPQMDFETDPIRVAGPFNDWGNDGPAEKWQLRPRTTEDGGVLWECIVPRHDLKCGNENTVFKFVSADWHWLKVLECAPNHQVDDGHNTNYRFETNRTGRHVFLFDVKNGRGLDDRHGIGLKEAEGGVPIIPGLSFFDLATDLPLGARTEKKESGRLLLGHRQEVTIFRVFAPRAKSCAVEVFEDIDAADPQIHPMKLLPDGVTWQARLPGNLHGWYYYLRIDGCNDGISTLFDSERKILDPWALAVAGPFGPGIVIDTKTLPVRTRESGYATPQWQDLVVLEGHLRDLVAHAPVDILDDERLGFRGLTRWIGTEGSYLRTLGINALELLPIQQFDSPKRDAYHWGYMTTNFFSPSAHYAAEPERASQIDELSDLVAECHRHGIAVILDVVYNHVGEPPFLAFIDKGYYFQFEPNGEFTNWSGCGNTLRPESAMSRRLIIDSLVHLIETFDVDGFRFDLAELLTIEALREIEVALKAVKDSVILIAEPWSFRGTIAWDLRLLGYSFWNDGFREFMPGYLRGEGDAGSLRYFMKGSLDHLAAWPAQSVNYVESHDDRCFLDRITENDDFDGGDPTPNDIQRTHLMIAIVMCSIGIPMLAAGQDFLRSKRGLNNTYERGDVNALDYDRQKHFGRTQRYFHEWIAFRRSDWGDLIRLFDHPGADYVNFFSTDERSAGALLFNADFSHGGRQVLFAVNPETHPVDLFLDKLLPDGWVEVAGNNKFNMNGLFDDRLVGYKQTVHLEALDCGLWLRDG